MLRFLVGGLLAAGLALPASAQDLSKLDTSLNKVPADAAFYTSSLRLGEQIDLFLKSKAYAKLHSLPAAKFAIQQALKEANKPENPLAEIMKFLHAPENAELRDLIHDLGRQEVFGYGGDGATKLMTLMMQANGAMQFGPMMAALRGGGVGGDPQEAQVGAVLKALLASRDLIVVPEITAGFRLSKTAPAKSQLQRAEAHLQQMLPPELKGKVTALKGDGVEGLKIEVDGSMVPWSKIPWDKYEEDKDEFKPLIDKLKSLKLTVTLAVKSEYLLLSVAPDASPVTKFGQGPSLATRAEFAPIGRFIGSRIVSIGYSSLALAKSLGSKPDDMKAMGETVKTALDKAPLGDKIKAKIGKDLDAFAAEMATGIPKPAASMSFSFMTPTGMEGFGYTYDDAGAETKPLTILDQLGGSPILAVAGRGGDATPRYRSLVKWVKIFFGHLEEVVNEVAPEAQADQFKQGVQQILPFAKRFDELTGGALLPALADGQGAFVLDAKWTSKSWFPELDQKGKSLPMAEFGLAFGVSDADKLVEAFKGYRALVNDVLKVARDFGANIPDEGWPTPKTQKAGPATLYSWPLPAEGQDEQIAPNIGVSGKLLTIATNVRHAERLHRPNPAPAEFAKLAGGKAISSASVFDFASLLASAKPWVEHLGVPAIVEAIPEDSPEGIRKTDVPAQIATLLEVMGTLKRAMAVTYRDGTATVTHFETVIEDIK